MPLPKISTPSYELTLPSNGKKIKYRPFLVREEKILIMALETEDPKQLTDAVVQLLDSCILTRGVKVQKLATFDIEYLFLNIRSTSVGESINIMVTCPDDGKTQVPVTLYVDEIEVTKPDDHTTDIPLDKDMTLRMKYPSLSQFIENNFEVGNETIGNTMKVITSCIDMIYNEEESWNASDSTQKELESFVDQLNTKQFKTIESFFDTMPKLSHKITVKNPNTGVESDVILEGLAAFIN